MILLILKMEIGVPICHPTSTMDTQQLCQRKFGFSGLFQLGEITLRLYHFHTEPHKSLV